MTDLNILVAGAGGRMGRTNIRAVAEALDLVLTGALDREGADTVGIDAGALAGLLPLGVTVTDNVETALEGAHAIIDFTTPSASVALAQKAAEYGLVHVVGTTGCSEADEDAFHTAALSGARIVKAGNMSLGVNLLVALVKRAAKALGPEYDAEVLEMHHNKKVDAPSGTALMLGEAVAAGRGTDFKDKAVLSREGQTGPRVPGTIGFATLRGGNVVGEHKVLLVGPNERIELGHVAADRGLFASGALHAARWAAHKAPGLYSMADVLGLKD